MDFNNNEISQKFNNICLERANLGSLKFYKEFIYPLPFFPELVEKIQNASFIKCDLTKIPEGLAIYSSLKNLDLSENIIESIINWEFPNTINLKNLDLSMNKLKILSPGIPPSIIKLDLSYNPSIDLQSVWNLWLPNLETFNITNCEIFEFPNSKPAWSTTIRKLNLNGNKLTSIPEFIIHLPLLEDLFLFGNNIKIVNFEFI